MPPCQHWIFFFHAIGPHLTTITIFRRIISYCSLSCPWGYVILSRFTHLFVEIVFHYSEEISSSFMPFSNYTILCYELREGEGLGQQSWACCCHADLLCLIQPTLRLCGFYSLSLHSPLMPPFCTSCFDLSSSVYPHNLFCTINLCSVPLCPCSISLFSPHSIQDALILWMFIRSLSCASLVWFVDTLQCSFQTS